MHRNLSIIRFIKLKAMDNGIDNVSVINKKKHTFSILLFLKRKLLFFGWIFFTHELWAKVKLWEPGGSVVKLMTRILKVLS